MISIIIPLYNKEKSISSTLESIINQNFSNYEIIIVDDGSTDNSINIVEKYINLDNRIKLYKKNNGGVSSARNFGLTKVKGEWILFLDADDILLPNALNTLYNKTNDKFDIIAAKLPYNMHISKFEGKVKNNFMFYLLGIFNLRMGCAIIRRNILTNNAFDEKLNRFEDMKSILIWLKDSNIYVVNDTIMQYRREYSCLSNINSNANNDYIFHLDFNNKGFWEKCILGKLVYIGFISYPSKKKALINKYKRYIFYVILGRLFGILIKIKQSFS